MRIFLCPADLCDIIASSRTCNEQMFWAQSAAHAREAAAGACRARRSSATSIYQQNVRTNSSIHAIATLLVAQLQHTHTLTEPDTEQAVLQEPLVFPHTHKYAACYSSYRIQTDRERRRSCPLGHDGHAAGAEEDGGEGEELEPDAALQPGPHEVGGEELDERHVVEQPR